MRVVGYARRSTKKQKYSLDVQRSAIEKYCRDNGHSIIEIIEETSTGANLFREGIMRAIEMVNDGTIDAIVCHTVDRLTRSVDDAEEIDCTIGLDKVIFIADCHKDVLELISMASQEINLTSLRSSNTLQHKKENGYYLGPTRYGFKVKDGKLIPVQEQIEIMNKIKQCYDNGMALNAIARWLNHDGVKTLRAAEWTQVQVKACVNRMNDPSLIKIIEEAQWNRTEHSA